MGFSSWLYLPVIKLLAIITGKAVLDPLKPKVGTCVGRVPGSCLQSDLVPAVIWGGGHDEPDMKESLCLYLFLSLQF